MTMQHAFAAELWIWDAGTKGSRFFVTVPEDVSVDLRFEAREPRGNRERPRTAVDAMFLMVSWYEMGPAGATRDLWVALAGPTAPEYGVWKTPGEEPVHEVLCVAARTDAMYALGAKASRPQSHPREAT